MKTGNPRKEEENDVVGRTQKRLSYGALWGAVLFGGLFLLLGEKAVAKGLILGTCFSVVNFFLLGKSIPLTLGRSRNRARLIGLGSILFRYLVLAVPLIAAVKSNKFDFAAVVAGIFAVQIAIMIDHFLLKPVMHRQ
jgi:hypothetical protein